MSSFGIRIFRENGADNFSKIHKLLLSAQSKFFLKAFTGDWKVCWNLNYLIIRHVDAKQIDSDGCVDLEEDNVEAMARFMYIFDYNLSGISWDGFSPMVFNIKVYSIADKYDIPALQVLAKEKFEKAVRVCWDMADFPDAIAQVYDSTPGQELRKGIESMVCIHIDELLSKLRFRNVLEETVEFASAIVQQLNKNRASSCKKYRYPSCNKQWEAILPKGSCCYYTHCGKNRSDWASFLVK